ncbi:MAG TPA: penicillin-binding protein 2, partial [Candidatus Portnoybacteria bacterium]|nr:penicillin-binding protein 2 [Candidatus Portnoybacteria bacterium]
TGQFEVPLKQKYLLWFFGLIILSLGILIFRAGWLQIVKGNYYQEIAEGNRIQTSLIKAPRGVIYDRDGQQLVRNIPSFDLVIIPNLLPEDEIHLRSLITLLSSTTGKSRQEIEKIISQSNPASLEPVLIQENLDREQVLILETKSWELSGVRLEENAIRDYINGPYFSHLLGYPGKITKPELTIHPDYSLTDYIGKTGLEFTYESVLKGEPGQKKEEVDSSGEVRKVISFQEPTPGHNLVLFLDADLQKKLTESLKKALQRTGASRASAIALDPRNGGILALVSLPNFDNNLFAQGISQEDYQSIIQNPDEPLFNRAISGEYPPGSTIKPLIALAALEENIISPEQQIYCSGVIGIPNQYNPQIITYFRDWKAHGATNLIKAIAQSGNVYFYTIGGGYDRIEGLGIERISKYVRLFGLGQSLGIDLPNEWSGLIPSRAWKEETFGERWYLGDTYHAAIGQGDIRVTPLQITAAIAAVANGGKLYYPQVIDKIIDSDKNIVRDIKSEIIRKDFIKSKNIQVVQQGMREAIISGSSQALFDLPFKVAGKTGTAQFGTQGKTHAWFTSYAPFDNPEIVLTVLIEEGGGGSQAALPVAKEVLQWYLSQ